MRIGVEPSLIFAKESFSVELTHGKLNSDGAKCFTGFYGKFNEFQQRNLFFFGPLT
jgi:hypothetical protein